METVFLGETAITLTGTDNSLMNSTLYC